MVDDDRPRVLSDHLERGALGRVFLWFETRILQISSLQMARYRDTRNRVALSFNPNMACDFDRVAQIVRIARTFRHLDDMAGLRKFFAFWIVQGRLKIDAQSELGRKLKEEDMPEILNIWIEEGRKQGLEKGMETGLEKGLRQARLEDARRMFERGYEWEAITDITQLRPEDLLAD